MDKHVMKHFTNQTDDLKENIVKLYEDDPRGAKLDLKAIDVMEKKVKKNKPEDAHRILEALHQKYQNLHSHQALDKMHIITSIILSIILSISTALGIFMMVKGKIPLRDIPVEEETLRKDFPKITKEETVKTGTMKDVLPTLKDKDVPPPKDSRPPPPPPPKDSRPPQDYAEEISNIIKTASEEGSDVQDLLRKGKLKRGYTISKETKSRKAKKFPPVQTE